MKTASGFAQLFLRIALGIGFILPVLDRTGFLGSLGSPDVSWGDWNHFIVYTKSLMPYLNQTVANLMGIIVTLAELTIGVCLIVGIKIRIISLAAAILTFIFGISMAVFVRPGAPFVYPVFVFTGAGLVLSGLGHYKWSFDEYFLGKS